MYIIVPGISRVDFSAGSQQNFANVDDTMTRGVVQGGASANRQENQQTIGNAAGDEKIVPVIFRVDVSFRIQQHFAHVNVVVAGRPVQGNALADKKKINNTISNKRKWRLYRLSFALTSAFASNNTLHTST